jgi:hypothetical protein
MTPGPPPEGRAQLLRSLARPKGAFIRERSAGKLTMKVVSFETKK